MSFETEVKVLEVKRNDIVSLMNKLKAKKVLDSRLFVDWFRTPGVKEGKDLWFLRVRSDANGSCEVTWKVVSKILGNSRKCREINVRCSSHKDMCDLLEAAGLEEYAHQEKDRVSWIYKEWRLDLDTYPGIPTYLEIEGKSEEHVNEALKLLSLADYPLNSTGERVLIQKRYGLDWYNMRFSKSDKV